MNYETDTSLASWEYYYDDRSTQFIKNDASMSSDKLQILAGAVISLISVGGSLSLVIHGDMAYTLAGYADYFTGINLFSRTYVTDSQSSYSEFRLIQQSTTSEIVVSHYEV